MSGKSWSISFEVPLLYAEIIAETIAEQVDAVSTIDEDEFSDPRKMTAISRNKPDLPAIDAQMKNLAEIFGFDSPKLKMEELPHKDWLEAVYRGFEPLHLGNFFIHNSRYEDTPPENSISVQIDAATAFGTGEHFSTKGCLIAAGKLAKDGFEPKNILDMGCGSAILAIAAAKCWDIKGLCVDIDAESIRVSKENIGINNVEDKLNAVTGDGYSTLDVNKNAPYDLIFANILAGPLVEMAPELAAVLNKGGRAILSGLLQKQADRVIKAHEAAGLTLIENAHHENWSTLIFRA